MLPHDLKTACTKCTKCTFSCQRIIASTLTLRRETPVDLTGKLIGAAGCTFRYARNKNNHLHVPPKVRYNVQN